jgi:hypothetical protein
LRKSVRCAPQLECPARLQAFAFQPDAPPRDFALDQRGALDLTGDPLASGKDTIVRRFRLMY